MTLHNRLHMVHAAREVTDVAAARVSKVQQKIADLVKAAEFDVLLEEAKADLTAARDTLYTVIAVAQKEALAEFAKDGVKTKPGVTVKEYTVLEYDGASALAWAVEKDMALKLDVRAFEKIVKVMETPPAFVDAVKEARAQISKDLSAFEEDDLPF